MTAPSAFKARLPLPLLTLLVLLIPLVLLMACTTPAGDGAPGVQIIGSVRNESGDPVAHATVHVGFFHRTTTDDAGRFRLQYLPPGEYTVRIHADGYENARENVTVAGKTSYLQATLTSITELTEQLIVALRLGYPRRAAELSQRMHAIDPDDPRTRLVQHLVGETEDAP